MRSQDDVPLSAKQLFSIGPRTETAVRELFRERQSSLFPQEEASAASVPREDIELLARALLEPRWGDEEAEALIREVAHRKGRGLAVDLPLISRWVLAHPNDAASVALCLDVEPPAEIEIRKVLSRAGSQKIVFLGSWRLTQREVVVKRLLRLDGTAERELESFPLTVSHHNIIETHRLQNGLGELFLVEELLSEVLSDKWRVHDLQEAANLLYDIAAAIKHLHDHDRVHGDIKPDNIGKRLGDYVLLDFGICRPVCEFAKDTTATGSLRTRAPELLLTGHYDDPRKVDVWALGATLFAAYSGRFPLIDEGEQVPRISHPSERQAFEQELARRVRDEWTTRVQCDQIPEEMRSIVERMLVRVPSERLSSADLLAAVETSLPAFIRGASEKAQRAGRFSPVEELDQLDAFLRALSLNTLLPAHKRARLKERLRQLEATQGFTQADRGRARDLAARLEMGAK